MSAFYQPYYPQQFSFSYPVIKYIFTNPSSGELWNKLIKTCKYFFGNRPVYPVYELSAIFGWQWEGDNVRFCSSDDFPYLFVYHTLTATFLNIPPEAVSYLVSKIKKCDLKVLRLHSQNLTWKEYQFLISSKKFKLLQLKCCIIRDISNGSMITVDKLLENLKDLEMFDMNCGEISLWFEHESVQNIVSILPRFKNLKSFRLCGLTETFDFSAFINFLLLNESINFSFSFALNVNLIYDYKLIIETFIDTLIAFPIKKIPDIGMTIFRDRYQYLKYQKL